MSFRPSGLEIAPPTPRGVTWPPLVRLKKEALRSVTLEGSARNGSSAPGLPGKRSPFRAGDLVSIYGADQDQTRPDQRRQLLGFLEVKPVPIKDAERFRPTARLTHWTTLRAM